MVTGLCYYLLMSSIRFQVLLLCFWPGFQWEEMVLTAKPLQRHTLLFEFKYSVRTLWNHAVVLSAFQKLPHAFQLHGGPWIFQRTQISCLKLLLFGGLHRPHAIRVCNAQRCIQGNNIMRKNTASDQMPNKTLGLVNHERSRFPSFITSFSLQMYKQKAPCQQNLNRIDSSLNQPKNWYSENCAQIMQTHTRPVLHCASWEPRALFQLTRVSLNSFGSQVSSDYPETKGRDFSKFSTLSSIERKRKICSLVFSWVHGCKDTTTIQHVGVPLSCMLPKLMHAGVLVLFTLPICTCVSLRGTR